jgi:hypothetical protein
MCVSRFAKDLRARGISVWLDVFEIEVGDRPRLKIEDAIANARFFCLVMSEPAIKSFYV